MKISIKTLILNLVIPSIIFIGVIVFSTITIVDGDVRDKTHIEMLEAELVATEVEEFISNLEVYIENTVDVHMINFINELDSDGEAITLEEHAEVIDYLHNEQIANDFDILYVASTRSRDFITSREVTLPQDYDPRTRPWFINAMKNKGFTLTGPYMSAEEGNPIILTISYPIFNGYFSDEIIGVVGIDLKLTKMIENLKQHETSDTVLILWAGDTKKIVYNNKYSISDDISLEKVMELLEYPEHDKEYLRQKFDEAFISRNSVSAPAELRTVLMAPVKNSNLMVSISFSSATFKKTVISNVFKYIIPVFAVYLLFLLGSFLIILTSVVRPIKKTSKAFEQLSSTDADLSVKIISNTKDEIQDMTENFNLFTDKLKNIVIKLKENTVKSNDISHDLTASVEETAAAINQIIANIASIQKQIENVDKSVVTTGASVEQITENIDKLEKEIGNQAAMVEESSASITQMMSSLNSVALITEKKTEGVEKLAQSAIKGKNQLEFTNKTFAETVVARMDTINEMAKTIESIANQTNLLSMNAAIEAAHAGEYGRGFAVVAEEIRKLADNSAKSSKEISLTLKEVMNGVSATGQSAEATSVEFNKILEEVEDTKNALMEINSNTKELTVGGKEIIKAVEELNSATANIKTSSIEIADNAKQILIEQQNLTNISSTVASGTAEIQTGSAEIGDAMQLVSELNHKLKEVVSSIKEETDKFKV